MSSLITPAVGTFTAKEVAQVVELDLAAFGVLGIPAAGDLTRDDVAALMAELRRRGYAARAYSLEVFLRQRKEVPSRALIVRPAWMDRADLQ
ncbi:MAG TPA: hypothetical protein VG734_20755 [Lacunisphaera sp.]|nr:hypothetical protein [Lacunisphaera sp.]